MGKIVITLKQQKYAGMFLEFLHSCVGPKCEPTDTPQTEVQYSNLVFIGWKNKGS